LKKNYQETIAYLYQQLPMFQRQGTPAFKKDLSNTWRLMEMLGHPQRRFPCVHIAGTNGKGSSAHMLSAIFQSAGYRTGLYTSPHYRDFRERIKIDGQLMTESAVVNFVDRYRDQFEAIQPSFFEITVAMAFDYFAQEKVDFAVIETGMGGRLDSTNVVRPELSVITNISFDHQEFLGDTLEKIAFEKAGIIKEHTPVVVGEWQAETAAVFTKVAGERGAPLRFAQEQYRVEVIQQNLEATLLQVYRADGLMYPHLLLGASGAYQAKNLCTVLTAVEHLAASFDIGRELNIRYALARLRPLTHFMGRWQLLQRRPRVLVDSAHNEAGIALLLQQLGQLSFQRLHLVIGMVRDKKRDLILSGMPKNGQYYFARPDIPRGLGVEILREEAQAYGLQGTAYSSVKLALQAALAEAAADDLVFVGGSTFVVAEVL